MAYWTFNFNNQSWGTAEFQWYGGDGSPGLGCMYAPGTVTPFDFVESTITGLSIPVVTDDPLSFRVRVKTSTPTAPGCAMAFGGGPTASCFSAGLDDSTGDTGWVTITGAVTLGGTVTDVIIRIGSVLLDDVITEGYFDSVYVAESPAAGPTPRRYLGMAADNANLYLTSINDNTLVLEYFAVSTPGTILDSFTFGTAAYTEPDTYTRAIYPAVVGDLELYLYGRDGSSVQVQYNDINGTAGWVDAGPGTATWGTAKYCVAFMPQPFAPRNLIAAFSDDDIYHTVVGIDDGWTKMGDAGTALRTAGRVTTEFGRILVAGQGTAQMYYSQNYGVSFTNALSGLAGTVNAIEVSR